MLIKFGSIVTDGRGKLGGQVYSKNRAGSYVRNNAIPSNPRTTFQMKSRNLLAQLSQAWSGLTEQERNAWNGAVEKFPRKNVFGDTRNLTGKNLFTSLNKNLLQVGKSQLEVPPAPADSIGISDYSAISNIAEDELEINVTTENSNGDLVIRATPPVSPGKTYVKNLLRVIDYGSATGNAQTVNVLNTYTDRFGSLSENQVIYFGIYSVNSAGVKSPEVIFRHIIQ